MQEIKILELFGGIGALTQAFKRTGIPHKIVDYVEIDKYAVASYNAMNDTNFDPQDICTWNKDIDVDLIMHGSPCQDFSLSGKGEGGDIGSGTRSSLMWETIRIVEKLKPNYVIWENVKNLLSKKHRHNFDAYLETMEKLGYTNYYQVLNAKDYGIPQNRERVFTISILGDEKYTFPKEKELKKLPIDLIEENVDTKYDLTEKNIKHYQREFGSKGKELNLYEPIPTLTASMGTGGGNIPYFTFPPKQELKLKLKDLLEDEVDEKYYLSDRMINYFYKNEQVQKEKGNGFRFNVSDGNVIAKTITTRAGSRMDDNFLKLPNKALRETLELNEISNEEVQYIDSYNRKIRDDGLSKTITTRVNASNNDYLLIKNNTKKGYLEAYDGDGVDISGRMQWHRGTVQKQMIQTINTSQDYGVVVKSVYSDLEKKLFTEDGNIKRYVNSDVVDEFKEGQMATTSFPNGYGHGPRTHDESICLNCIDKPSVKQNLRIRKLTPKEAWRLMGFDDDAFDKAAKINSNSQLYKQAGNSIVVNVLEGIIKNLFK